MKMRPLQDSDWPAFCRFADTYFGNSHNHDAAFNRHWFKTDLYDGWAAMVLDDGDGELAGIMMAIVVPTWFAGKSTTMAWISTGVVEPAARARGAGAQLFMWIYKTFPLVGALSGNEFSNPVNSTLGNEIPGVAIRRFIRMHDARAAALCQPQDRERIARMSVAAGDQSAGNLSARWVDDIPKDYAVLWNTFRKSVFMTTERSADFLQWRYRDVPITRYRFLEMRRGNSLSAVATVRIQDTPEGPVCRIVDFVADPTAAADAWRSVAVEAAKLGASFSDFFVIGSTQDSALQTAGFLPADDTTGLIALPHLLSPVEHRRWSNTVHFGGRLTKETEDWRSADAVYFTKADSDRDWPTPYDLKQISGTRPVIPDASAEAAVASETG